MTEELRGTTLMGSLSQRKPSGLRERYLLACVDSAVIESSSIVPLAPIVPRPILWSPIHGPRWHRMWAVGEWALIVEVSRRRPRTVIIASLWKIT